jgi:hypothetical protein
MDSMKDELGDDVAAPTSEVCVCVCVCVCGSRVVRATVPSSVVEARHSLLQSPF